MSVTKLLSLALLVLLLLLNREAKAGTFEDYALDDDEPREERTFFTSGGTYYLTLNTTFVIITGLILTGLTLGALALSAFIGLIGKPNIKSYSASYNYPSAYSHDSYYDSHYYKRKRRIQRSESDIGSIKLNFYVIFETLFG